jgi:galactokinase
MRLRKGSETPSRWSGATKKMAKQGHSVAGDSGERVGPVSRLTADFLQRYGGSGRDVRFFFAPGRVNLIGEHTDYNGGHVLPAATSMGIRAAVRPTGGRLVRLASADLSGTRDVDLDGEVFFDERDGWTNYPKGVIAFLLHGGYLLGGCEILYSGDLPVGAGLSSSAAVEVLTAYLLLYPRLGDSVDRVWIARMCQAVENRFVGVGCGIMDQFTVAMGKRDMAILLDCASLNYEYIPVELGDFRLAIMDTGKRRRLEASQFNLRREECGEALAAIRLHKTVPNLCSATLADVEAYVPDETLRKRARHVISENKRTIEAARLLSLGDLAGFGRLMVESHYSLKYDYEVTGPELDTIVEEALSFEACLGARMTGAGFAGCAIALVRGRELAGFTEKVSAGYRLRTGFNGSIYDCSLGDGARAGIPELPVPR